MLSTILMNMCIRLGIGAICTSMSLGVSCHVPSRDNPSEMVGITCLCRSEETGFMALALENEQGQLIDIDIRIPDGIHY